MMNSVTSITTEADSLLDLLIAQCLDLESLLVLSRSEAVAAESRDFEAIIRISQERATLGERLEIYHRQIAEMRQRLGAAAEPTMQGSMAMRVTELVNGILTQDRDTQPLLMAVREEITQERKSLDQTQRGLSAYLNDGRIPAMACDQLA